MNKTHLLHAGGHMKNIKHYTSLILFFTLAFGLGCAQEFEEKAEKIEQPLLLPKIKVELIEPISAKKEVVEQESLSAGSFLGNSETAPSELAPLAKTAEFENMDIGPLGPDISTPLEVLPFPPIATPITAPWEFAKHPFDRTVNVDPALANYVGSYGVLPSRLGPAPFLYSLSVSKGAAFDDDGGPHRRR